MNSLGLVFLGSVIVLSLAVAWEAQQGFKKCICCKPRRRFRSVAERKFHEQIRWQ